ncbi:MAG: LytR/AlgR family response regulator transcription factor [Bacteroidota bacterium]
MLKTVIIDDENTARETIAHMVELYGDGTLDIVAYAENVKEGIATINKHNPDLVMLDIKMPDGTGFEVLDAFGDINFDVIFVTAYEQYAIKAFKFAALDYILKPIDPNEFKKAIARTTRRKETKALNMQVKTMMEYMNHSPREGKKIVLRSINSIHLVYVHDIVRAESDRNYSRFYFLDEPPVTVAKSLRNFIDVLEEYGFIRVHQSHLINTDHIKKYMKNDFVVVMNDNSEVPVSHRKRDFLLKQFEEL